MQAAMSDRYGVKVELSGPLDNFRIQPCTLIECEAIARMGLRRAAARAGVGLSIPTYEIKIENGRRYFCAEAVVT
jgi:hypothetical protein